MVRVSCKLILETVQDAIDLTIGECGLAEKNSLTEVWMVHFWRDFLHAGG